MVLVKVQMCGLLTCGDLSLAFFSHVLYFTEKFHCLIPESQKVSLLQVFSVQSPSGDSCRTTVLDLEWGPDVHPDMWKSKTSSAGTDLKLDPHHHLGLVLKG